MHLHHVHHSSRACVAVLSLQTSLSLTRNINVTVAKELYYIFSEILILITLNWRWVYFGWEIRKITFKYAPLSGGLFMLSLFIDHWPFQLVTDKFLYAFCNFKIWISEILKIRILEFSTIKVHMEYLMGCWYRPPDKIAQKSSCYKFLNQNMLWVLKRTVSMRRFFWAPNTHVKTDW